MTLFDGYHFFCLCVKYKQFFRKMKNQTNKKRCTKKVRFIGDFFFYYYFIILIFHFLEKLLIFQEKTKKKVPAKKGHLTPNGAKKCSICTTIKIRWVEVFWYNNNYISLVSNQRKNCF
jgi:hypothetical protein